MAAEQIMAAEKEKPYFAVLVERTEAREKASALLLSKRHKGFEIGQETLFYVPYWLFSYDIHDTVAGKTKVVASGSGALNAFSKVFDPRVSGLVHSPAKRNTFSSHEMGEEVLRVRFSEAEVREMLPVMLASKHAASKDNVILSGIELVYAPFWRLSIQLDGQTVEMNVSAVDGKVIGTGEIEALEKTKSALVQETFRELSNPVEWVRYSAEIISRLASGVAKVRSAGKDSGSGHGAGHAGPGHRPDHARQSHSEVSVSRGGFSISEPDTRVLLLGILAMLVIIWVFFLQ